MQLDRLRVGVSGVEPAPSWGGLGWTQCKSARIYGCKFSRKYLLLRVMSFQRVSF